MVHAVPMSYLCLWDRWHMQSVCPSFTFGTDGARGSVSIGNAKTLTYLTYFDLFWPILTNFDLFWPILTYLTYLDLFWPNLTFFTFFDLFDIVDLFWTIWPILTYGTHFDAKFSMFGLVPSAMEEGAEGPQNGPKGRGGPKGPQPFAETRRRGAERPELLVLNIWWEICVKNTRRGGKVTT